MYLNKLIVLISVSICFGMTISCNSKKYHWDGQQVNDGNITTIKNYGKPFLEKDFSLDNILSVTTNDEIDGKFITKIYDVLVIDGKGLFIADATNMRICSFDFDGKVNQCFGREGSGPGEFRNIGNLIYNASNQLIGVFDNKLNRISWFNIDDNNFIKSVILKDRIGDIIYLENEGLIISKYPFHREDNFIDIIDANGNVYESLLDINSETLMNIRSGNTVKTAIHGSKLLFAFPNPYLIQIHDGIDFSLLKKITLQKHGFILAESNTLNEIPSGQILGNEMNSKLNDIFIDNEGSYIVVESQTTQAMSELDYFDFDGKYLFSVDLPKEHEIAHVNGNFIVTFIRGTYEEMAGVFFWEKISK